MVTFNKKTITDLQTFESLTLARDNKYQRLISITSSPWSNWPRVRCHLLTRVSVIIRRLSPMSHPRSGIVAIFICHSTNALQPAATRSDAHHSYSFIFMMKLLNINVLNRNAFATFSLFLLKGYHALDVAS